MLQSRFSPYIVRKLPSGGIKRVVLFSSSVSVGLLKINYEYSEKDWNDDAIDDVKAKGKNAGGLMKYMASKTLAERSAMILCEAPRTDCLLIPSARCLGALQ